MSKPEFKQLLEEYISNLEIDYTSNQNGASITLHYQESAKYNALNTGNSS